MSEGATIYQIGDAATIVRDKGEASYFTMIPNMVDDDERLTIEAIRLYLHYRRRAGENGGCTEGQRATMAHCRMSPNTIVSAKRLLQECGYITVARVLRPDNRWGDVITVVNVWQENSLRYCKIPRYPTVPDAVSHDTVSDILPDTVKKNQYNNQYNNHSVPTVLKSTRSRTPEPPVNEAYLTELQDQYSAFDVGWEWARCLDYYAGRGKVIKSERPTLRNWMRNELKWRKEREAKTVAPEAAEPKRRNLAAWLDGDE